MYSVKIFNAAKHDLKDIVDYLNRLSPQTAIKYYDLILEQIGSLANMPKRCPLVKDTQLRLRGYRCLNIKNYIVFYTIKGNIVQVRRILYARREYEWML